MPVAGIYAMGQESNVSDALAPARLAKDEARRRITENRCGHLC